MMNNCNYNKIKVLFRVSKLLGFIEIHAIKDAENDGHPECADYFKQLKDDLQKHLEKSRSTLEMVSKEGQLE